MIKVIIVVLSIISCIEPALAKGKVLTTIQESGRIVETKKYGEDKRVLRRVMNVVDTYEQKTEVVLESLKDRRDIILAQLTDIDGLIAQIQIIEDAIPLVSCDNTDVKKCINQEDCLSVEGEWSNKKCKEIVVQ